MPLTPRGGDVPTKNATCGFCDTSDNCSSCRQPCEKSDRINRATDRPCNTGFSSGRIKREATGTYPRNRAALASVMIAVLRPDPIGPQIATVLHPVPTPSPKICATLVTLSRTTSMRPDDASGRRLIASGIGSDWSISKPDVESGTNLATPCACLTAYGSCASIVHPV